MAIYMIRQTRKRTSVECVKWLEWFQKHDCHHWIIAQETGNGGLKHWQIRVHCSLTWEEMKIEFPDAHIEKSDKWTEYERKEGKFFQWNDTVDILKTRFGTPRFYQKCILKLLDLQNDRQILVWYDPIGNKGKSWLCNHMYETGQAFYCPPTLKTPKDIIQYIASGYNEEGVIIIDIPRIAKWSMELMIAIETVKDGLIYDTRYNTRIRNVRGVKVLVMTNNKVYKQGLSADRWVIAKY